MENVVGSLPTISELSLVLKAFQVTVKQPAGVSVVDGSDIVFELSSKRLKVVLVGVQGFSVSTAIEGHKIVKVNEPVCYVV